MHGHGGGGGAQVHNHGHGHGNPKSKEEKKEEEEKKSHWQLFVATLPFLWPKGNCGVKVRVVGALFCLFAGKLAELAVPLSLSLLIDDVADVTQEKAADRNWNSLVVPIIVYGLLRFSTSLFSELRNIIYAHVSAFTERKVALMTFEHLQELSLRFHLTRKTGSVIRSVSRGASSFGTVSRIVLFQIMPVFFQVVIVCAFLLVRFDWWFAVITFFTIVGYFVFTIVTTEWRNKFRRAMNESDNEFNQKAVDALLNFETVKFFVSEEHEKRRFDDALVRYQDASIVSNQSLAVLNGGQGLVIAAGVIVAMVLAAREVGDGTMTVGEFVLVNQFILSLYTPLGFLGTYHRMLKQTLLDVENMFQLMSKNVEVRDKPDARSLEVKEGLIEFDKVTFAYDPEGDAPILNDISFRVEPGQSVGICGKTGAGKSTLARLLYRFYDVQDGAVRVDGVDVRDVTQASLRRHVAAVPQDTVLFNDTIGYNIHYGRVGGPHAPFAADPKGKDYGTDDEVVEASKAASIYDFIVKLKDGFKTQVGERGLRLSGGEKQRVAIARAILKRPRILVFDEATSSLDSRTEKDIQAAFDRVSKGRTTLVIAHRLSTIVACDKILVLRGGRIVEQGTHDELLLIEGGEYREMWELQKRQEHVLEEMHELGLDADDDE